MRVVHLTQADLVWPHSNATHQYPHYNHGLGRHKRTTYVYPEPCYHHDVARVEDLVAKCCERAPIGKGELAILDHEFTGHNNGFTAKDYDYDTPQEMTKSYEGVEERAYLLAHTIALCGKVIPIQPAMTRYLVTHEYGHAVWDYKERVLGYSGKGETLFEQLYMKLRGQPDYKEDRSHPYWHRLMSEIIANDFRRQVMETEMEFWPHEVPEDPGFLVKSFWKAQTREEMEQVIACVR